MELYCRCGYPILVAGHWMGREYCLSLHDPKQGKGSRAILTCPNCGVYFGPDDLDQSLPADIEWPPQETEPDEYEA